MEIWRRHDLYTKIGGFKWFCIKFFVDLRLKSRIRLIKNSINSLWWSQRTLESSFFRKFFTKNVVPLNSFLPTPICLVLGILKWKRNPQLRISNMIRIQLYKNKFLLMWNRRSFFKNAKVRWGQRNSKTLVLKI
jgi:hypothetical protein